MSKVTMREMLTAGVHFGHQTRYWNPCMAPYIYGSRHKIHIINLEKTLPMFNDMLSFISTVAGKRGKVLFVGTKQAAQQVIRDQAIRCGMPYVNHRWLGGMLTNYKTIRNSIKRLKTLEAMHAKGGFEGLTKKEELNLQREQAKLHRSVGGIKAMGGLPDALFIIDVGHEKIAIAEANRLRIPVVGIVDTNHSPDGVDYMVPGNDDALRAIELYTSRVADTIIEARKHLTEPEPEKAKEKAPPSEKKQPAKRKVVIKKVAVKQPEETTEKAAAAEAKKAKAPAKKPAIAEKAADTKPKAAAKKPAAGKTADEIAKSTAKKAEPKAAAAKKPVAKKPTKTAKADSPAAKKAAAVSASDASEK